MTLKPRFEVRNNRGVKMMAALYSSEDAQAQAVQLSEEDGGALYMVADLFVDPEIHGSDIVWTTEYSTDEMRYPEDRPCRS